MTAPTGVLRIDTSGTAFGAAPTWTDRSSYLMSGSSYPIDITWGGQDQRSEPSPRTCTFFLKNDDGFWTPGNAAAPAAWDVGCRANLRVTYNATTYDRFDGYVESIEPTWPGGSPSWSVVKVSCSDLGTRLGAGQPLESILVQEMLADSPLYLYKLDEPVGSVSAGDITGNVAPATRVDSYGTGVLRFGEGNGLFDEGTGVQTSDDFQAAASGPTSALSVPDAVLPGSGAHTIEAWIVTPTDTAPSNPGDVVSMPTPGQTYGLLFRTSATSGRFIYGLQDDAGNVGTIFSTSGVNLCDGGLHHVVGTLASNRTDMRLYVDGEEVGTATATGALTFTGMQYNFIGAASNGVGKAETPFPGVISHVALYDTELSAARVLAHYQYGIGTGTESTDARFTRLAGYGGITVSGLPTGMGTCGAQRTKGFTVTEALQKVARTEGTKAWVEGAGSMTFEARNARYWPTAGLTLDGADITADSFAVRRDRQGFANEATTTRDGGAAQRHVNATSQTAVGRFDAGSFEVATSTDFEALQLAAWKVKTSSAASTRIPDLKVNLLALTNTTTVANALDATIGTYVALTGLPSNGPATSMNLFVEGATERIGVAEWTIGFFTSPEPTDSTGAVIQTLRADAAASARTALDAGLVIPL